MHRMAAKSPALPPRLHTSARAAERAARSSRMSSDMSVRGRGLRIVHDQPRAVEARFNSNDELWPGCGRGCAYMQQAQLQAGEAASLRSVWRRAVHAELAWGCGRESS